MNLTIKISGVKTPHQFDDVNQAVRGMLYRKGTDDYLFADMPRELADLAMAEINATPGLKAEIFHW